MGTTGDLTLGWCDWQSLIQKEAGQSLTSAAVCVCPVVSYSLWPHGLWPTRLSCPWDSPSKNTGVSCHFLIQGIFQTQGLSPCLSCLLHCRQILYHWSTGEASYQFKSPRWASKRGGFCSECSFCFVLFLNKSKKTKWQMLWLYFCLFVILLSGEENDNPLQYSCLENPMDRGAWWATVHGVAKNQSRLGN